VWAEQLRVGPVYTKQPGEVSVVIEVPPGVTPTAADLHFLAGGNPIVTAQEIKSFRASGEDMALVVCVDVSGSMASRPLEDIKEALLLLLGKARARPRDKIALVSFADEEKIMSSFEQPRDQLDDAVRSLKKRGNKTRLYQTVYKALDMLQAADLPPRRRIIVMSDGKDEGSTETPMIVATKSTTLGIPIDTVGHGRIEPQYVEALRYLSDTTGGQFVHARPDRLSLPDALDRIYENLLEMRSLMVYFKYEVDRAGHTIQNASIKLHQPGQPEYKGDMLASMAAPRAEITPPPPTPPVKDESPPPTPPVKDDPTSRHVPSWLWLLVPILVVVSLVVLVRRRPKNPPQPHKLDITPSVVDLPQWSPPPVPLPGQPRRTQVGSYYFPLPQPGQPSAILLGLTGSVDGQQFSVEKEVFHIGAHPHNDLPIVNDEYVSGEHAYLRYEQGSFFLFDKGSRNGTFVNQQAVPETGLALGVGDQIQVGRSTFEVRRGTS
jgi:Mg-chelatase subunit ChlD